MKIIGLCGRSGSGKGYVSCLFSDFGGLYIDTDSVYHSLLLPVDGRASALGIKLARQFGGGVVTEDGCVDRRALGRIVFSDSGALSKLNSITHSAVIAEVKRIIERSDAPFALVDAPLLFESGFDRFCDFTVCVVADDSVCVERIVSRDGISPKEAETRLSAQMSAAELSEKCSFTVYNNDGDNLKEQVHRILEKTGIVKNT